MRYNKHKDPPWKSMPRFTLVLLVALTLLGTTITFAQASDVSDNVWSIIMPSAAGRNIDMGKVLVGDSKDSVVADFLVNTGPADIRIGGLDLIGTDSLQFSIEAGSSSFQIAQGGNKSVEFQFRPTSEGMKVATIRVVTQVDTMEYTIRGEGMPSEFSATLAVDTIWARPGDAVEIVLRLKSARNHSLTGATGFTADLRFNAALLSPTGIVPTGSMSNGERSIPIDDIPLFADQHGILKRLTFVATLGDAEGTPLYLDNAAAVGGEIAVSGIPGYFFLKDICREGGTRLFDGNGQVQLHQNSPNPFNASTVIQYEVIEASHTKLYVLDQLGRKVTVLVDETVQPGVYSKVFDASHLPSGTYHCILQTPTIRKTMLMEVVK